MDRIGDILYPKNPKPPAVEKNHSSEQSSPQGTVSVSELKVLIVNMKKDLDKMLRVLEGETVNLAPKESVEEKKPESEAGTEKVIEGVFNGVKMISEDGSVYDVPPNYASKSKLVEGDMMKLTIPAHGKFVYKQIGPIERDRVRGVLHYNEGENQWSIVSATGKSYKVLTASVTFYKGKAKDEAIALIPQNGHSEWAAVEHIISQ